MIRTQESRGMTQAKAKYGSWEEWHQRVDEEKRTVNFHVHGDADDRSGLEDWMSIHLSYLSQFGRVSRDPVSVTELVQAEVSRD